MKYLHETTLTCVATNEFNTDGDCLFSNCDNEKLSHTACELPMQYYAVDVLPNQIRRPDNGGH